MTGPIEVAPGNEVVELSSPDGLVGTVVVTVTGGGAQVVGSGATKASATTSAASVGPIRPVANRTSSAQIG